MTYPAATANLVVLWGRWWDHLSKAGVDATITATPLLATGQAGSGSPNLVSLVDQAEIKTAAWSTKPLPGSGLWALPLLPTNDAQFGAFGGYRIQAGSEPPFIVEILESTPTMVMSADMIAALNAARTQSNAAPIGISVNDVAQAVWVRQAAMLQSPAVAPPTGVLTSDQVVNLVAGVRQLPSGGTPGQVPTPKAGGGYEWVAQSGGGGAAFSGNAAEITTGLIDDARIPQSITRDSELSAAVVAALVEVRGGAPAAFDTLMEIIDRLTQDETSIASLLATVGGKLAKTSNLSDLPDAAAARTALGLAAVAKSGSAADLTSGVLADARIPDSITRDSELTAAVTAALVEIRGGAPAAYDTLMELIDRLAQDETGLASLLAAVGGKADKLTQRTVAVTATSSAGDKVAAPNEIVVLDSSSGTFTLTGPPGGALYWGWRWKAGAAANAPTIAAGAGYTINGAASVTPGLAPAGSPGELAVYELFGTDYQPVGGFKPQTAITALYDARYATPAYARSQALVMALAMGD